MAMSAARTPRLAPEVRRRQLLDAALEVLNASGFGAVTVEAVAARAGVTRPVVYDMFGDLDGLMLALLEREEQRALTPLLEILGQDPGQEVEAEDFLLDAVGAFLGAVRSSPRTWRLLLMPPPGSSVELRERIMRSRRLLAERISELLDWGIAQRGGPLGLDHPLLARLIVAAGEDAARLTLAHPRRFPPRRLVATARDALALLPAGMRPRGNPPPALTPAVRREPAPAPPPPGRRMPRAQRREQLLDLALGLLADEGFDALSMEAIARCAGVNRVVVYRSFPNLQLLLVALLRREDRRTASVLEAILPADPDDRAPGQLLGEALARFLGAVLQDPQTWRVALLRPESAPIALRKLVNRRRAQFARRLEPLVSWGLANLATTPSTIDIEILARMLLSVGEEQGRLALDAPEFPPERLIAASWALLDGLTGS